MTFWKGLIPALGLALTIATPASAALINIDSTSDVGTTIELSGGNYEATVVGTAGGGAYDAWNMWGNDVTSGCDEGGVCTTNGWHLQYRVTKSDGSVWSRTQPETLYETTALALANTVVLVFTVPFTQNVLFQNIDSNYTDNYGGVSLMITLIHSEVPEPPQFLFMAFGLLGVVTVAAKRRRDAKAIS